VAGGRRRAPNPGFRIWKKGEAGVIREPVLQVEFSASSGELLVPTDEGGDVMVDLLLSMQGMRVYGGDDATA